MNLGEMHSEIERKLRNLDVIIDTPTTELSSIIYECVYKFIDKYYKTFEEDERSRKALGLLTIETDITPSSADPIFPNSYRATLPTNPELLYTVLEIVTLDGVEVKVKPISLDAYRTSLKNPFKNPYNNLVWRLELIPSGTTTKIHILVVPAGSTLTNYKLGYIKNPTKYTIEDNPTSELEIPDIFQYEIIDMAVEMFLNSYSLLNTKNV